jgi:hypothetical protein
VTSPGVVDLTGDGSTFNFASVDRLAAGAEVTVEGLFAAGRLATGERSVIMAFTTNYPPSYAPAPSYSPATANATVGAGMTGIVVVPQPEPGSLVLLAMGALGLGGYTWRRKNIVA